MLHHIHNSLRLLRIALVLAWHDALFPLQSLGAPSPVIFFSKILVRRRRGVARAVALREALQALGPTFVKLGQALSTRSDLVGEEIAAELAELQDNLPPFPSEDARKIIEQELGDDINNLFLDFDDKAAAAASIAQVHFAVLPDGKKVAVKILRPGIRRAFSRDIELFYWLARLAEKSSPAARRLKAVEVVSTFEEMVRVELDLRFEAAAAEELRENLRADGGIYVPEVFWHHTAERVLVLERIEGIAIDDIAALQAAGHNLEKLVQQAASSFFCQVFRDGFFHADMHAGNLFVQPNGRIAVVDFGIMGWVDRETRMFVAAILKGFLRADYHYVAEIHIRYGYVPAHKSVEQFALACRAIAQPILGKPLNEISVARLLGQLFAVAETFDMETQPKLLLLQKTMMMAEGIGRKLSPNTNMWKLAEPLIMEWAQKNMGTQAQLKAGAEEARDIALRLPAMLKRADQVLRELESGGLKIHPDTVKRLQRNRKSLQSKWLTVAWTALAAAVFIALLFYLR